MNKEKEELERQKEILEIKRKLDNKEISFDDLLLDEVEEVGELYKEEIKSLAKEIKELHEENVKLEKELGLK